LITHTILAAALNRAKLRFQTERHGNRNAIERIFREIKRQVFLFINGFNTVDPATTKTWPKSFAGW
jgi:putative transposase